MKSELKTMTLVKSSHSLAVVAVVALSTVYHLENILLSVMFLWQKQKTDWQHNNNGTWAQTSYN